MKTKVDGRSCCRPRSVRLLVALPLKYTSLLRMMYLHLVINLTAELMLWLCHGWQAAYGVGLATYHLGQRDDAVEPLRMYFKVEDELREEGAGKANTCTSLQMTLHISLHMLSHMSLHSMLWSWRSLMCVADIVEPSHVCGRYR